MSKTQSTRRQVIAAAAGLTVSAVSKADAQAAGEPSRGSQRLSLDRLHAWEALGYGMFINYGMSTFVGK